jgi:beta-lactam-binding protein with PASTA domain
MTENKSYLDTFADKKPESFNEETFVAVRNKSKSTKIIVAVVIIAVILAGSFTVYGFMNNVQVPKLAGITLDEANAWATKNRIILAAKSVYNFQSASGLVIAQEIAAGSTIQKNSALAIEVSLGADPDEKITWPDIKSMTTSQVEAWISENKLTGVKIVNANSDIVAADQVISYTLTDDTEANFVRKSRATINVSIGPATQSDTVIVTDFSAMKAAAILQWGDVNGVVISFTEAFDDYIPAGNVISQSVKAATEILKTEPVTVVISVGKQITVPNFSVMSQADAGSWAKSSSITLTILEKYSGSVAKGNFLAQGITAGTGIKEGYTLSLTYSLGKVEVASFIGRTKLDILNWQLGINANNANIRLTFSEAYGEKGTFGKIIGQSIQNDYVNPGSAISVVLSLGMKLLTPDFAGKSEAECGDLAKSAGVTVLFNYQTSSTVNKGFVISQSPAKDTVMTDDHSITVVISISGTAVKTVTVPDFRTMTQLDASAWAKTNSITLVFIEKYQDTAAKGVLFEQSAAAGTGISQGAAITIGYSLGQIEMTSFIKKSKLDMLNWLADVNSKGANLSVVYTYANDKSYDMNIIIGQSIMNTYISTGTSITFNISWDPGA